MGLVDFTKQNAPKFDARAPEYRRKLWARIEAPNGSVEVVFFWWRILAALLLLAVAGWLAAAGAVYGFVRVRHDFADVSYWNLALPSRWPLHRRALGHHYIELGQQAMATGNYVDAAQFYGAGVARDPDDLPARRQLAIIYIRFGQLTAGLTLLGAGLEQAREDLEYLKLTFSLLSETQDDTRILELTQKYLPVKPDEILTHQFLALQAATAYYQRGNYDAAEQTVAAWRLGRSLEGQLLLARCDWERGYPDLAVVRLTEQREHFPDRDELSLQLIRFYRDLGRNEAALNEALVRHVADPASPGPRIDLLYAWQRNSDETRLAREREAYLKDFASDANALLLLAWFAADTGDLELSRRLHSLAAAEAALKGPAGQDPRFAAVLSGLRALACFGAGDPSNGETNLQAFLVREHLRAGDALLLARRLNELGARPQALHVLTTAVRHDPQNQAALTELVHLETAAANQEALEAYTPQLLAMRKPSRAVLQESFLVLNEATPARAALRHAIKAALEKSTPTPEPGL
jgi:tetratricopeptide (TPR) repeat protein